MGDFGCILQSQIFIGIFYNIILVYKINLSIFAMCKE